MFKRLKSFIVVIVLLIGLLGNIITVSAEELETNVEPDEKIEIPLDISNEQSEYIENKNLNQINNNIMIEQNPLDATRSNAKVDNTNPNEAMVIPVNSLVNDAIKEAGQQRWYAFAANTGKLTLNLDCSNSPDVDYDLYLYQYDDTTGNIIPLDGNESNGSIEHFSCMVNEGIYFVLVNSYLGYDAFNQYSLGVVLSTSFDELEANDRIQDASVLSDIEFNTVGTIDNQFDVDIYKFTVESKGTIYISFTNNGSLQNIYAADILNTNGVKLEQLEQNKSFYADLLPGTYYFKVYCSTFGGDYTSTYTLKGDVRRNAARVEVTHAGDAELPIVDYVDGPYWRVYSTSYVEGIAYDANGYIIPNADVTIKVKVELNKVDKIASGRTDSQGKFKIKLNLGPGAGIYNYYNQGISIHYYDIVDVSFLSNENAIPGNIDKFYHFARQIML